MLRVGALAGAHVGTDEVSTTADLVPARCVVWDCGLRVVAEQARCQADCPDLRPEKLRPPRCQPLHAAVGDDVTVGVDDPAGEFEEGNAVRRQGGTGSHWRQEASQAVRVLERRRYGLDRSRRVGSAASVSRATTRGQDERKRESR